VTRRRVVVRGPNHLGDGVMARPAIAALAEIAEVVVHAPGWRHDLYGDLPVHLLPRGTLADGDVAVLLAPSLRAAWEARHLPVRIGTPTDGRRWLLTRVVQPATHTADTYARLARAAGARRIEGAPTLSAPAAPPGPAHDVPDGHLALHPLSATPATRQWPGFRALADRASGPVVFYGGPGQEQQLAAIAGSHPMRPGLPLDQLAACLRRARLLVSVDTGPAHFARAHGVPTLVVYGGTAPQGSGPAGALAVEGQAPCRPCYASRCRQRAPMCLDIDVERVLSVVEGRHG
jgi:ADP-heptose:LPS heptosyltransferase